jgi:hypothetical protein
MSFPYSRLRRVRIWILLNLYSLWITIESFTYPQLFGSP